MTREEKIAIFDKFCERHNCNVSCPLSKWCDDVSVHLCDESELDNMLMLIESNNVNHPTHYNREGALECIDEMILVFGKEATMTFCLLNAWKYRYRAADKNGEEDLRKSDWYLNKVKELKGE